MIDIYIGIFIFGMLLHELMHVKGHGFRATGKMTIHEAGLTTILNNMKNYRWFYASGGVLSGLVLLWFALRTTGTIQFVFLSNAIIQFIYGLYEYKVKGLVTRIRYAIYVGIPVLSFIIWKVLI